MCCRCNPNRDVPYGDQSAKALEWVRRSVAHRTAQAICEEVAMRTNRMRILQLRELSYASRGRSFMFQRRDIVCEELLGRGAFCEVYNVQVQSLQTAAGRETDTSSSEGESHNNHSNSQTTNTGSSAPAATTKLVLKQLRGDLVVHAGTFRQAASDLIIEAKLLARLSHPNIITVHGWSANGAASYANGRNGGFFILLDRLDETLTQRMERWKSWDDSTANRLTSTSWQHERQSPIRQTPTSRAWQRFADKLGYACQIAQALEYLHSRDLIFRDLKPDNIGFRGDDLVQLFDFGLCCELPEQNPPPDVVYDLSGVGSRRYLAPEVILGSGYNQKVDVYSLSMVLYEMLSLEKPFEMYTKEIHEALVVEGGVRPKLHSDWPVELQSLLQESWARNPCQRPCIRNVKAQLRSVVQAAEQRLLVHKNRIIQLIVQLDDLFAVQPVSPDQHSKADRTERTSSLSESTFTFIFDDR